jgi:hypothetical protein
MAAKGGMGLLILAHSKKAGQKGPDMPEAEGKGMGNHKLAMAEAMIAAHKSGDAKGLDKALSAYLDAHHIENSTPEDPHAETKESEDETEE